MNIIKNKLTRKIKLFFLKKYIYIIKIHLLIATEIYARSNKRIIVYKKINSIEYNFFLIYGSFIPVITNAYRYCYFIFSRLNEYFSSHLVSQQRNVFDVLHVLEFFKETISTLFSRVYIYIRYSNCIT